MRLQVGAEYPVNDALGEPRFTARCIPTAAGMIVVADITVLVSSLGQRGLCLTWPLTGGFTRYAQLVGGHSGHLMRLRGGCGVFGNTKRCYRRRAGDGVGMDIQSPASWAKSTMAAAVLVTANCAT